MTLNEALGNSEKAYFIQFKKVEQSTFLNNYILPNFSRILGSEVTDKIGIEENEFGQDVMVVFIQDSVVDEFIEFCCEESLIHEHFDCTEILLEGKKLPLVLDKMIKSEEFKPLFDSFFFKNLTIDDILEKINSKGLQSLTEIDKKILANGI